MKKQFFQCMGKPGAVYERIGKSSPAGTIKSDGGACVVVYRNIATDALYHRDPDDFDVRMVEVEAPVKRSVGWGAGGYVS